jgi:competence protein ComEA
MKRHTLAVLFMGACLAAGASEAASKKAPKQLTGVINLNTASVVQLDQLPGVGPKAAERIVAFRNRTPFSRPEDLIKVKGFGKKKLDKLKGHLTVAGPTTLKVMTGKEDPAEAPAVQGRGLAAQPKR